MADSSQAGRVGAWSSALLGLAAALMPFLLAQVTPVTLVGAAAGLVVALLGGVVAFGRASVERVRTLALIQGLLGLVVALHGLLGPPSPAYVLGAGVAGFGIVLVSSIESRDGGASRPRRA